MKNIAAIHALQKRHIESILECTGLNNIVPQTGPYGTHIETTGGEHIFVRESIGTIAECLSKHQSLRQLEFGLQERPFARTTPTRIF